MKLYVLFDIDGTLIEDKKYPKNIEKIKVAISFLKDNGVTFGICTARPFDYEVRKIIEDYNIDGSVISEGGACFYEKEMGKYKLRKTIPNKIVDLKCHISNILKMQNLEMNKDILLNQNRIMTSTIKLSKDHEDKIDKLIEVLKNEETLKEQEIKVSNENKFKIIIEPKYNNKIKAIKNWFENKNVIFISDYEENVEMHDSSIKIYSVGENKEFNASSD